MEICSLFLVIFLSLLSLNAATSAPAGRTPGSWKILKRSIGVSAMHMQLLHNDRVVIFDRTDFGLSNLSLPNGKCRHDPTERVVKNDCTAHSVEYDVLSDECRPLMVLTDTWCSSGSTIPNGQLIQTGGFSDGERAVRSFRPCSTCDWHEYPTALLVKRWYATNCLLPDGRQIIVGGRRQFNYEFFPRSESSSDINNELFNLPLLRKTKDKEENNLYPFVHLNVDGNLFIYSNNRAILFDYVKNVVVKNFPMMPGGNPRNYPSSGSSVLLPLDPSGKKAEVLVCGGAPKGSFLSARNNGNLKRALDTCGRISITDPNPEWRMEKMPMPRVMGDMILLPNARQVLIINGAGVGTAGWEYAEEPVLSPVIYEVNNPAGSRFQVQTATTIPRLYHSSAIPLRDGRVLVGGSNPHIGYDFYGKKYPTELSLETFSPEYLSEENSKHRPVISDTGNTITSLRYGQEFMVRFSFPIAGKILRDMSSVQVTMMRPPFTTHSHSMNQRVVLLAVTMVGDVGTMYEVQVVAPMSAVIAPPGHYMLFVSYGDIPSEGIWVKIQ